MGGGGLQVGEAVLQAGPWACRGGRGRPGASRGARNRREVLAGRVAGPEGHQCGSRLASCCTEKGEVLVGKLYRGTGGGGGARANVRALADRGSSGGERERPGLGSEKAGEGGKSDGPAGREGGEWMEEPRDAGEGHLAEGEASTRVGEAGGLAGLGHLAAGEESTRVGDAGGGVR